MFDIVAYFIKQIIFKILYPIYLLKHKQEKEYIVNRLEKAGLQISSKEVYKNLFFNAIDSLHFLQNKKVLFKLENEHLIKDEIANNPIVFVSIHLGAFEMLHRVLAGFNVNVNLIVSEFKNKRTDSFLTKLRQTKNVKIVKDYEVSKILKNAIHNKEIIATMADQSKGKVESFQILGSSVPLFLKLPLTANKLGASLVFFRTFKKNGIHIIRFEKLYAPKAEIDKNALAKMFESWILEYPEQWAWNYGYKSACLWAGNLLISEEY